MPARAVGTTVARWRNRTLRSHARRRRGRGHRDECIQERIRYDANVCGGDFAHLRERFDTWKRESRIYRPERRMFDGKDEVRALNDTVYDGPERAQRRSSRNARRPTGSRSRPGSPPRGARCGW